MKLVHLYCATAAAIVLIAGLGIHATTAEAASTAQQARWDTSPAYSSSVTADSTTGSTASTYAGAYLSVECDGAFYWLPGTAITGSQARHTAAAPDGTAYVQLKRTEKQLHIKCVSGTCTCQVFRHAQH